MNVVTASFLKAFFCTLATFCLFWMVAKPVMAASSGVSFSGIVVKNEAIDGIVSYPLAIVSFGNEAALPLDTEMARSDDLRVFDAKGKPLLNTRKASLSIRNDNPVSHQVVPLEDFAVQQFTVCASSKRLCVRYKVLRY